MTVRRPQAVTMMGSKRPDITEPACAARLRGLAAPWVPDGPITGAAFNLYVETQLAPTLHKGDVCHSG